MRLSLWSSVLMAGSCLAQGDLAALLRSQDDLSTLLELVSLVPGLTDTLSAASNITIMAPTNKAFAKVPRNEPEGEAIEYRNETIAVAALLANLQRSLPIKRHHRHSHLCADLAQRLVHHSETTLLQLHRWRL
jgi:hypothetical protein